MMIFINFSWCFGDKLLFSVCSCRRCCCSLVSLLRCLLNFRITTLFSFRCRMFWLFSIPHWSLPSDLSGLNFRNLMNFAYYRCCEEWMTDWWIELKRKEVLRLLIRAFVLLVWDFWLSFWTHFWFTHPTYR